MPKVIASSFADPRDIAAYKAAKAHGLSDQEAFRIGDNGIGAWGTYTGDENGPPMCALPVEDWKARYPHSGQAGAPVKVTVTRTGKETICFLRDTMPHKAYIHNGRGIDLNPAACKALGLDYHSLSEVVIWEWAPRTDLA